MAIEQVFTWLAIFIWVGLGAIIVLAIWVTVERRREKARIEYAPFAELLGKPCRMNEGGEWGKYRVVAVSHKGSVAIRRSGASAGAEWIDKKVAKGALRFGDDGRERL